MGIKRKSLFCLNVRKNPHAWHDNVARKYFKFKIIIQCNIEVVNGHLQPK